MNKQINVKPKSDLELLFEKKTEDEDNIDPIKMLNKNEEIEEDLEVLYGPLLGDDSDAGDDIDYVAIIRETLDDIVSRSTLTSDDIFVRCRLNKLDESYFQYAVDKGLFDNIDVEKKLMLAAEGGSLKYVKEALDQGATINPSDFDNTPLMIACQNGHLEIVKYLVYSGADINKLRFGEGFSSLHIAAQFGQLEVIKFLLEKGVDINCLSRYCFPPLTIAVNHDQFDVAEYLLQQGADVNISICEGNSPLLFASGNNNWELVELLVDYGANINHQDNRGTCALHYAVQYQNLKMVKYLVERKSEIEFDSMDHGTPLNYAKRNFFTDIYDYLLEFNRGKKIKHILGDINNKTQLSI